MDFLLLLVAGLAAGLASYLCVYVLRGWAERRLLDIPNARSLHIRPVPRGGGLAVVLVSLGGAWAWYAFRLEALSLPGMLAFTLAAGLVAAVSFWDDLRSLPNRVRFSAHALAAVLVLLAYGPWNELQLPLLGTVRLGWLSLPVTFVWLVGLTNAYNFMDGIDGIAGGQALAAGLGWLALGVLLGQPLVGIFGLLLAASSLGFLGHNWSPARIFMGDVGSAYLGFVFAALAVVAGRAHPALPLAAVLLVWPFVFDTAFTFLRRLSLGEDVFAAHRSHLYQRMVQAGLSHARVAGVYTGLAFLGVFLSVALIQGWPGVGWMISGVLLVGGAGLWRGACWLEGSSSTRLEGRLQA
jgi:UDP-GlcNAc:undecaprenyl-phosphate/decaprenyl-phosphate GlcNAc-1-phosphate transferase